MHFRQSHKKYFAGRVLDGPHEGDWIEEDEPFFEAYWQRQLCPVPIALSLDIPNAGFEIDRAYYRWLHGYRAWAWVQPPLQRKF
jgi:hypothetical protein